MSSPPRSFSLRQRGFSSLALLSAGALLLSSSGAGVLAFAKDADALVQGFSRRPQGAFTQAPVRAFLGARPGRDPHGRGGLWPAYRRAEAGEYAANERLVVRQGPGPIEQEQHTLAVEAEPGSSLPWEGSANGVNTGNGNKLTTLPLFGWTVRGGMALDLTLYHNSQSVYDDELGRGWTWTYDVYVNNLTGDPVLHWGDGTAIPYAAPGSGGGGGGGGSPDAEDEGLFEGLYAMVGGAFQGAATSYTAPSGIHDALVKNADGTWSLTRKDGTAYSFNAAGFLKRVQDRNGNAIVLTLDAGNYVTRITDPTGRYVDVAQNAAHRFTSMTDHTGRTWSFAYDANGDLTSVTPPSLGTAVTDSFSYTGHRITAHTDRRGKVWSYAYNADGSLASEADPLGHATTYTYGSTGTTVTDALGHASVDNYSSGSLASRVDASGYSVSFTARDAGRNVTTTVDGRGKTWGASFDAKGNPLTTTDPLGHVKTVTYDAYAKPLTVKDALNHVTTYAYDGSGNLTSVVDALGHTLLTNSYGSWGLLTARTDALGKSTTVGYDANGYPNATTDPTGVTASVSYDELGRPVSTTDGAGATTTVTYDAWGRASATVLPAVGGVSATTSATYLATGQTASSTDALGHTTSYAYDNAGRLTSVTNPRGDVESYGYDNADASNERDQRAGQDPDVRLHEPGRRERADDARRLVRVLGRTTARGTRRRTSTA